MSQNTVAPNIGARTNPRSVFFNGTGALVEGQGLCYNRDYGTAASEDGRRDKEVELPHQSNNQWFAGVTAKAYAANPLGQMVEIYEPGSVCRVSTLIGTTIGTTRLTCMAHAASGTNLVSGRAIAAGFYGRGSARALQTITALTDTTTTPGVINSSLDGSATVDAAGTTITKTGLFANCAIGDKVVVVAGSLTSGMTTEVTYGEYTLSSVTSDNAAVVSSAMCSAASSIACYVIRGNPTCLCYLEEGPQSGMVEWITPDSATAKPSMVGGYTYIFGGATITTDSTFTLADGQTPGQLKLWRLMGALTTNDYLVTLGTTGEQLDGTTDLASLEFDGADDSSMLIWGGQYWRLLVNKGTGLA